MHSAPITKHHNRCDQRFGETSPSNPLASGYTLIAAPLATAAAPHATCSRSSATRLRIINAAHNPLLCVFCIAPSASRNTMPSAHAAARDVSSNVIAVVSASAFVTFHRSNPTEYGRIANGANNKAKVGEYLNKSNCVKGYCAYRFVPCTRCTKLSRKIW